MINTYSLKADGGKQLSANFKVQEFACKDGSDQVKIDDGLVALCQAIRDHFGKPVTIHSGYRTEAYNSRIGGAKSSKHITGEAADIKVSGVNPIVVALYAQDVLNAPGIGLYSYVKVSDGFVHVDTRASTWRGLQVKNSGGSQSISGYFPTVRSGVKSNAVVVLQRLLALSDDGAFGPKTGAAVKDFQQYAGLVADGICGAKTWAALTGKL